MDAERFRAFLLGLPDVVETMQWGANLVYWVGDKAIGGKMFAWLNLDEPRESANGKPHLVLSYAAGPERYAELLELEGLVPAPYAAKNFWVAAESWSVFTTAEWQRELRAAHALTVEKLPPKARKVLALSPAEQKKAIAARRKELAARASK